jgi:hypothetical protein
MKKLCHDLALVCGALLILCLSSSAFGSCSAPANSIEAENCLPGNPSSQWDVSGAGDPTIQGFATDISVNLGQTVLFKVKTDATAYTIEIYRMGYYGGMGARLITTLLPSASLPQAQPACLSDSSTGLVDCGNWAVSGSWHLPANAVSGIYFAHLVRSDTGGDSHIVFIVRNDNSNSAMLFQTSDETWQAYNGYGGSSLYGPDLQFDLTNRAYKVSYNRPFDTRAFGVEDVTWVFGAEYPMVRWLEANGYDVTYYTGVDAARNGNVITNHKVYLSVGHDEYWSEAHRTNVEAARDAGVNLAFFSGNEVFWKTRWENSVDGTNTPYRTLVCYKETLAAAPIDPLDPPTWTGTWRDARFSPPADGGRPENSLTGTLFAVNGPGTDNPGNLSIKVPASDGKMRFWRNTNFANLAAGQTGALPAGTLGYEWDEDLDNGTRPTGTFELSTATYSLTTDLLLDQGATYGAGVAAHHMTLHRATSGALVFGAGSVQYSWGLDSNHDGSPVQPVSLIMQQATVNLFADMGVQPATLQAGLLAATASTDTTPPSSIIMWPTNGGSISSGSTVTVTGTASDTGGGVIGGVEISLDGGTSWHPAVGRETWSYSWRPSATGAVTIKSRATDDSANVEIPSTGNSVITVNPPDCPCSDWSSSTTPSQVDSGDGSAGEYGVRFRADYDGYITGVRFYKSAKNTGTHIGHLWSNTGSLLATVTFANETSSGWQQATFSNPVAITANTTYVASYFAPIGHYSDSAGYFATSDADAPPLHFLANGVDGANGIYSYSSTSTFPTSSFDATNYWVDVVYLPASSMPGAPAALLAYPFSLSFAAYSGQPNPPAQTVTVYNEGAGNLTWTATSSAPWLLASPGTGGTPSSLSVSVNSAGLASGTYTGTITVSAAGSDLPAQTISVSLALTNLLMSSNFSDGTMSGWALSPLGLASGWTVVNQSLQYAGLGNSQVYSGNSAWTNYSLNVGVKLSTTNNWPGGIRGHINPSTGAGYAVWLYPAQGLLILYRTSAWDINQTLVQLGQAAAAFDTVNFHNVGLSFNGSQIQVSYDGTTVITATDPTYTSGLVALEGENQNVTFDNVVVTSSTPNSGSIAVGSNSLSFSANYQGANPAAQTDQLSGSGGTFVWSASSSAPWLTASPSSGTTPSTLQVSVASSALSPGNYSGVVTVTAPGAGNSPTTISVSLSVVAQPPALVVSPLSLSFSAVKGQTAPAQSVAITNGGYGSFGWTASSDSSWLTISPASGSTPQSMTVTADPSVIATGSYTGHITVTASGVGNSPQTIPITLEVFSPDMTETFGDLGSGWIISPMGLASGWTVSNGVYSYTGSGLSQSCAGNGGWTDYTFDSNIQLSNLSNWPGGVRARVNPATGAGYAVWLYPGLGEAILYRVPQWNVNGPGVTQLGVSPLTFNTTGSHDVQMKFQGSLISVYWDGTFLMSTTDSTYPSGFVCLDADSQPISYSNIRVAAVQSQLTLDSINPSSLIFKSGPGSSPAPQTVNVTAGGANTTWAASSNVSWIIATASATLTPATLIVAVNPSGMAPGTYSGSVTLSAPGASNSPITIPVTLAVKSALLSVNPTSMMFFGAVGLNPNPLILQISNAGTGSLNWTSSNTSSWLALSLTSGAAPLTVTVTPETSTTGTGTFNDTVTVSSNDVTNSPVTVPVTMQVGSLLFSDNFNSLTDTNWTISPLGFASGWSFVNGAYTYNGGGHTQSYAGNPSWTDYTVSADVQLASLNDYPGGLRGRVNTTTGSSYGVWIYPAERTLKLFQIGQWNIDAGFALLGQASQLNMDTNWHNLRLAFQGTNIQVYYDNTLVITATDANYAQGAVALDVSNQPIAFDNVTVISLP